MELGNANSHNMNMDFLTITKHYYAKWVDVEPSLLDKEGVFVVFSPERDKKQLGYADQFDLYYFLTPGTAIISYGQRLRKDIAHIEQCFSGKEDINNIKAALHKHLGIHPQHEYKYYFTTFTAGLDTTQAKQLTKNDYPSFLHLHRCQYPHGNQEDWLEDYFNTQADKGYVYGVYVDQLLVSATEIPDLPYMRDIVAEPGINTLSEYRRQGYAKVVVGALLKHLIEDQKIPLWSTNSKNVASQKLAESLGYVKFADVITVTL